MLREHYHSHFLNSYFLDICNLILKVYFSIRLSETCNIEQEKLNHYFLSEFCDRNLSDLQVNCQ